MSSLIFKKGQIVVLDLPFTDMAGSKSRPCLIISSDKFNENSNDVIVTKISSNSYDSDYEVKINKSDLSSGKLKKTSYIDLGALWTVEKKLIQKNIAVLNEVTSRLCDKKIIEIFGVN